MRKVVSFFGLFLLICSCFMGVSCVNNIDGVGSIVLKMPGSSSRATSPAGSLNNNGTYKIDLFCEADRSEQHLTAKAEETVVINYVRIGYCTVVVTSLDSDGFPDKQGKTRVFIKKWIQNTANVTLREYTEPPKIEITKQPQDVTERLVSNEDGSGASYMMEKGFSISAKVKQKGTFSVNCFSCDPKGNKKDYVGKPYGDSVKKDGYTELQLTNPAHPGMYSKPGDYYYIFEITFIDNKQIYSEAVMSRVIHVKILPEIVTSWKRLRKIGGEITSSNDNEFEIYVSGKIDAGQVDGETWGGFDPSGKNVTIIAVDGGCTINKSNVNGFIFSLTGGGSLTLKGSPSSKLIIDGGGEACGSNYGLIGLNWEKSDSGKTAKLYVMENCVLQNNVNTYGKSLQSEGVAGAAIGFNISDGSQNPGKGSEIVVKGEIINCKGQNTSFGNYNENIIVTPYNHQVLIVK